MDERERAAELLRRPSEMRLTEFLGIIEGVGWRKVRQASSHVIVEDSEGHTHSIPTVSGRTIKRFYLRTTARRIDEIRRGD